MFKKRLLTALGAIVAAMTLAATAHAAPCEGLACPNVLPAGSVPQSTFLPTLPGGVKDLTKLSSSGYYTYNTPGVDSQRSVAYVVTPGTWVAAPAAIKQLPIGDHLLPAEVASKWLVIYGSGTMESGPWAPEPTASAAQKTKRAGGVKAFAAAASDCVSPYFCAFTNTSFGGNKCQWASTGVWQSMSGTSCYLNSESMVNTRSAWSLIKRNDGANYCAAPISQDASLSNNGFSNNSTDTYNSTATTKQSGWNCTN